MTKAQTDKRDAQVTEESLPSDFGVDDLAEIWTEVTPAPEDEGLELAGASSEQCAREP